MNIKSIRAILAVCFSIIFIINAFITVSAYEDLTLKLFVNDAEKDCKNIIGNVVDVNLSLELSELLMDGQGYITYDSDVLSLDDISFPNIDNIVFNSKINGKVMFNFCGIDTDNKSGIYNFIQEKTFVNLKFILNNRNVKETSVNLFFNELESYNNSYVYNSSVTDLGNIVFNSGISGKIEFSDLFETEEATTQNETFKTSFNVNGKKMSDTEVTDKEMTVQFMLKSPDLIMDGDGYISYDDNIFELSSVEFPKINSGLILNTNKTGQIFFNFLGVDTSVKKGIYDFTNEEIFVQLVFRTKGLNKSDTEISLMFKDLDSFDDSYVFDSEIQSEGKTIFDNMPLPIVSFSDSDDEYKYTFNDQSYMYLNDTFSRDGSDDKLTGISNQFKNLEILGVQKKLDTEMHSIRFVSVIDTKVLRDVDDYGYIVVGATTKDSAASIINQYSLITAPLKNVFTCKNTDNFISGNYGKYNTDTKYKYITYAVNNIKENAVAVKFYIKKNNKVYYANYTNKDSVTKNYCVTDWNSLV